LLNLQKNAVSSVGRERSVVLEGWGRGERGAVWAGG